MKELVQSFDERWARAGVLMQSRHHRTRRLTAQAYHPPPCPPPQCAKGSKHTIKYEHLYELPDVMRSEPVYPPFAEEFKKQYAKAETTEKVTNQCGDLGWQRLSWGWGWVLDPTAFLPVHLARQLPPHRASHAHGVNPRH